jgi:methionyl-tRNA synthetase
MKKKILITSALPYANGQLHFGHIAGAYLPADAYARFERLRGNDVLYICGSDEYGMAVTLSAELAQRSPQAHVDHYHAVFKQLFNNLAIQFDHYSRTTVAEHTPLVQQFFKELDENGYIEARETEQLFSSDDQRFLADRYVVGSCPRCSFEEARGDECPKCGASYEATDLKHPRSKLTGAPLVRKQTRHWFFLCDRFKPELEKFLSSRPWKTNVLHFAHSFLEELHPRCITRDIEWGVPLPLTEAQDKVFYVWFDAPIGYITFTQEWAKKIGQPDAWKTYWCDPKTHYVQFMGKDNIPFHALFFPAMVMGQNHPYKLVDDLVANEFYNLEGKKFSKSDGWLIELDDFFKKYHADQIRYTIAANAPETGDSEFTWKDFQTRCNSDLVGKFGNLANRVLVFAQNQCGGRIPLQHPLEEIDHRFLNEMSRLTADLEEAYVSYRLRRASQLMMELAQAGNVYFDLKAPWKDAKDPKSRPVMETTIALCLECLKRLACVSFPLIPHTAQKLWELLGFSKPLATELWHELMAYVLPTGRALPKPFILFTKIEDDVIEQEIQALHVMHSQAQQKQPPPFAPLKEQVTIDDFGKLDLRVGLILHAEKVAKSKKLLKLDIDIGFETRTILSGISLHYTPEELVGKKVMVVANLKPATLMGVESHGMILAGSLDASLELVTLNDLPAGAKIS